MDCACGHDISLHGRRGYGGCRYGRGGRLARATEAVRACVVAGVPEDQIGKVIDAAMAIEPCFCTRFHKGAAAEPPSKDSK